jgi:hypothetical protein
MFTFEQVVAAIDGVDTTVQNLVRQRRRVEILNERYFHHMFSTYLASTSQVDETWSNLAICPEYPTQFKFLRKEIRLDDLEYTRNNALGTGKAGNLDFHIPNKPPISVEWKGPKNCPEQDLSEVFLKFLNQNKTEIKIIAAIFLTKSGKRNHVNNLKEKLERSLQFACDVCEIESLQDQNLYAYIHSRYDEGCHNIWWGPVTEVNFH